MKRLMPANRRLDLAICCAVLLAVTLGCAGIKRPWRDYSDRPFSSAEWLAGDKIDRGRMVKSMFRNPEVEVANREMTLKTLGEPDLKKTIEGTEVWFYRVDIGIPGGLDLVPVSFSEKRGGHVGYAHGGTMSIMAKEEDL